MTTEMTSAERSLIMRSVGRKDTGPEMAVRRLLHAQGFRFRLHRKELPGSPDIVLPKHRLAIFVHGCFWHRHPGCPKATTPKTRSKFWLDKFRSNQERDRRVTRQLQRLGWEVMVVWGCETKNPDALRNRLRELLENQN